MSEPAILFMDYDNVWITCERQIGINIYELDFIKKLTDFIEQKGYYISQFIAYANFDNGKMATDKHQTKLQKLGVQTRHCMNGKDSADIAIACDVLEKLYLTNCDNSTYIIVSCDKDITPLINKIRSQGKKAILITFTVNIDWDVMKNYGDQHYWFEEVLGITYSEPAEKTEIDEESFKSELQTSITERAGDINYSLFSQSLQKRYNSNRSDIDQCKDQLIAQDIIEMYTYVFNGRSYNDGIRFKS